MNPDPAIRHAETRSAPEKPVSGMRRPDLRARDLDLLVRTFERFPCVREVRVFGSRASGHARRASDIDLAISAPDATARQWLELTEALDEAPIIYEIDVVRPERTSTPRLIEKIAREGLRIYQRP